MTVKTNNMVMAAHVYFLKDFLNEVLASMLPTKAFTMLVVGCA